MDSRCALLDSSTAPELLAYEKISKCIRQRAQKAGSSTLLFKNLSGCVGPACCRWLIRLAFRNSQSRAECARCRHVAWTGLVIISPPPILCRVAEQGKAWGGVFVGHSSSNPFETEADKKRLLLERFQAEVRSAVAHAVPLPAIAAQRRADRLLSPVPRSPAAPRLRLLRSRCDGASTRRSDIHGGDRGHAMTAVPRLVVVCVVVELCRHRRRIAAVGGVVHSSFLLQLTAVPPRVAAPLCSSNSSPFPELGGWLCSLKKDGGRRQRQEEDDGGRRDTTDNTAAAPLSSGSPFRPICNRFAV